MPRHIQRHRKLGCQRICRSHAAHAHAHTSCSTPSPKGLGPHLSSNAIAQPKLAPKPPFGYKAACPTPHSKNQGVDKSSMAAPKGNRFGSHDKPWTNALQRVLKQLEVKNADGQVIAKVGEALRLIAEETVTRAIAGDKDARKEIADRLDGKPTEFLNVNHTADPGNLSDDELANIASASRDRTAEAQESAPKPSELH